MRWLLISQLLFSCLAMTAVRVQQKSPRPNIIVMQPDDFQFMKEWNPPAHISLDQTYSMVSNGTNLLPHITRLKENGLTMTRAYTASPMCGTSRFSTMTGRYPSRSANSRVRNADFNISEVTIPNTKLQDTADLDDGLDCSHSNMAALFKTNGYRTGMLGKWHLYGAGRTTVYDYETIQNEIRSCGFDTAEAVYWENLNDNWTNNGTFSHNTEHIVDEALKFMDSATEEPFFVYFNPTSPHSSGNVYEALTQYSCRDAPEGVLLEEPVVPGMTEGIGCDAYRQSILDRAETLFGTTEQATSNAILGAIWVDDAVGALLLHLETRGILDSTIFVWQLDHGQEGKSSVYEPGARIAQFVHYPNQIDPGSVYEGLVSTIDLAPTLTDYAGITSDSPGYYDVDGMSWKAMVEGTMPDDERCLAVELDFDRAIVCPCHKYLLLGDTGGGVGGGGGGGGRPNGGGRPGGRVLQRGARGTFSIGQQLGLITTSPAMFDLCDVNGNYISSSMSAPSPEATEISVASGSGTTVAALDRLERVMDCHLAMTVASGIPEYGVCDDIAMGSVVAEAGTTGADDSSAAASMDSLTVTAEDLTTATSNETIHMQNYTLSEGVGSTVVNMTVLTSPLSGTAATDSPAIPTEEADTTEEEVTTDEDGKNSSFIDNTTLGISGNPTTEDVSKKATSPVSTSGASPLGVQFAWFAIGVAFFRVSLYLDT